jgi:lipopolysaccharide transport system ATP-binding protein
MSTTVIRVENISKQYRLGNVGLGSFSADINRWYQTRLRGREDPYLKIGEENNRSLKGESDYVWALQDINFELKQGDVLGIIGGNGAGKSTLLKILSRTTTPTTGQIKIKGRVASLLEVGTGFHPELTGRENIFLNGAILGMTKREVKSKLDEIVDFAGVERYIDTPVKRYSSGMYVRLAFGVAAHLDPEILIVDEVLAVGDAEFQKKAIGKMKDVSGKDGRTVLFVSHNIQAIQKLCTIGIMLENGFVAYKGNIKNTIDKYLEGSSENQPYFLNNSLKEDSGILEVKVVNVENQLCSSFNFDEQVKIYFKLKIDCKHLNTTFGFRVKDQFDRNVFSSEIKVKEYVFSTGVYDFSVQIPKALLVPNYYKLIIALHVINEKIISILEDIICFEIIESGTNFSEYLEADYGCVLIECLWTKN